MILCQSARPPAIWQDFFESESSEFCGFNLQLYFCVCVNFWFVSVSYLSFNFLPLPTFIKGTEWLHGLLCFVQINNLLFHWVLCASFKGILMCCCSIFQWKFKCSFLILHFRSSVLLFPVVLRWAMSSSCCTVSVERQVVFWCISRNLVLSSLLWASISTFFSLKKLGYCFANFN